MSTVSYPHIEVRENGKVYIEDTGIKVRILVELHLAGADVAELQQNYPQLSRSHIHSALAYYYDHEDEIDREISELERIEEELRPRLENLTANAKLRDAMKQRKEHP